MTDSACWKPLLWISTSGITLFALHRFALWAECRGWIYYQRRKASPGSVGSALLQVQSLLEPGKVHVIKSQSERAAEEDDQGDTLSQSSTNESCREQNGKEFS